MGSGPSKPAASRRDPPQPATKGNKIPNPAKAVTPDSTPSVAHEDRGTAKNSSTVQSTKAQAVTSESRTSVSVEDKSKTKNSSTVQSPRDADEETNTSQRPVVIAIDFGTTYTGYAYQFIQQYNTNPEKISIPQPFNGGRHNMASTRTPTCILINKKLEVDSFGYEAEDRFEQECIEGKQDQFYFFKQFKMKLHGIKGLDSSFRLQDHTGKESLPANVVFSLAIKFLKKHALDTVRKEILRLEEKNILWVLTIPAIWDEEAVKFMKDAATLAGIEEKNLVIAYEPEAAAFACKYIPLTATTTFSDIEPGTHYMVVDLGGGTADIVIHKKLGGNKVKEVFRPSGGPWGGRAVDNKFIQFLIDIVGEPVFKRFQEKFHSDYMDLFREFEAKKRAFPQDVNMEKKVYLKIPVSLSEICKEETGKDFWENVQQTVFAHKMEFKGGMTVFDPEIFEDFFRDISNQIINHIKNLTATSAGAKIAIILLVGGFSQSPYIQNAIKDFFKGEKIKLLFPNEPELSVVKGAIIFARHSKLMACRDEQISKCVKNVDPLVYMYVINEKTQSRMSINEPQTTKTLAMITLAVGMDVSSLGLQFKHEYLRDPGQCRNVFEPGKREATQPCCLLLRPSNEVYGTGMMAHKHFGELRSKGVDQTWQFFQNIYPKQSAADTVEDHRSMSRKAVDILSSYINHEWQHMWRLFEERNVALSMTSNDAFTVIAVPAAFSEDAQFLVTRAAEMAGIKEERMCVVSESEAIYKYATICQPNKYRDLSSAPAGSRIAIANFGGTTGDLTFHEIQGHSLSAPYEIASGPWGSKSIANGIFEILAKVVGTSSVENFKKEFPTEYTDFVDGIVSGTKTYRSSGDANGKLKFRMSPCFNDFCKREHNSSLQEMLQNSPFSSKIEVSRDKLKITGNLLDCYFRRSTDSIIGQVDKSLVQRGENTFMILTGEFADFEEIKNILLPDLDRRQIRTILVPNNECPILRGASIFGWMR